MFQRSLMVPMGASVSIVAFAAFFGAANAQSVLGGCDPASGLGSNGQPCVELTPLDPNRIVGGSPDAAGGDQYSSLDTTTLGQTYACRQVDATSGSGQGGSLLFEDCGTPLTGSELGELKPFYGTTGAPAPAPAPVYTPPAPTPVAYTPPPPPPPPVVVAAPVAPALGTAGLGSAGLIAAGVGAAALIGIAIVALDDDDDNTSGTTGTN